MISEATLAAKAPHQFPVSVLRKRRFAPKFLCPYFWVFRGCSTGPACQCLFETLVLDSHACPRRSGFETRKSPHSCHQAPKQLPVILGRGRSKPSLRYPKGSVHLPTAPLPNPPQPTPPPQKKPKFSGQAPIWILRSVSCIWRNFRDNPKKFGTTSKLRKKVVPKIPPFFRGSIKVRPEIPCPGGRGAVSLGRL